MTPQDSPNPASKRAALRAEAAAFYGEWRRRAHQAPAPRMFVAAIWSVVIMAGLAFIAWRYDAEVARAMRSLPLPVYRVFNAITQIGASAYIFVTSALTAIVAVVVAAAQPLRATREGLRLLAGRALLVFTVTATSGLAAQILKQIVGRARPRLLDSAGAFHFDPFSMKATLASFPSGHTITAFAVAWTLSLFLPRWRYALFFVAVLVGMSRVVVGAHYPADVLAGAVIGLVSAWATCRAFAGRRLVLRFSPAGMVPRGGGMALAALRALAQRGKAQA